MTMPKGWKPSTNHNYAGSWMSKAISLIKSGRYQEAIECCDKVLGIAPDWAEVWELKGAAFLGLEMNSKAIEYVS
jgi:tetratricopeptide (TPR) repeat protein